MGKPKKNKKAEIKARRKTRKVNDRIADLKRREKMVRSYLEALQNVSKIQVEEERSTETASDSSSQDDQNSQSTSEYGKDT